MKYKFKTNIRKGEINAPDSRSAAKQVLGGEWPVYCSGNQWHPPEKFYGSKTGMVVMLEAIAPKATMCGPIGLTDAVAELEIELITKALKISGWNKAEAAALLNTKRTTLAKKIKRYGITK